MCVSERAGDRAELMDTWVWFQSGLNTDGAHNPLTSRRIRPGDILSLNCFPMIQGYYTALERTMFYKHTPSDAALKAQQFSPLQTCVYLCHLQGVLNIAKIPPPRRPGKTGHQNVKISRTILAIFGPIPRSISNNPIFSADLFLDICFECVLLRAKVWEANVAVHRRGLELIRPGARCRDIAAELNELFASLGLLKYR